MRFVQGNLRFLIVLGYCYLNEVQTYVACPNISQFSQVQSMPNDPWSHRGGGDTSRRLDQIASRGPRLGKLLRGQPG